MSDTADLSGFDIRATSQEGAEMPLLDPSGRRTQVVFRVRGNDSQAYQEMFKEHIRRGIARAPRKATEEERNAEFWELQATLVSSWTPGRIVFDKGGPSLDCTPANVAKVLEQHQWIYEQVQRFADKRANFLPGSSASSSPVAGTSASSPS